MFEHRRKAIGKSQYYISENNGCYIVKEIYNGSLVGKSKYIHHNIDDAISELNSISCERYYTDNSLGINF